MPHTLYLGGMHLVNNHGNVDVYTNGQSDLPIRIQRADLDDIIKFLKQVQKDTV